MDSLDLEFNTKKSLDEIICDIKKLKETADKKTLELINSIEDNIKLITESKEYFKQLISNSPDAIIIHDGKTIIYANEEAVKLHGVKSREDLIGKEVLHFIHKDDRDAIVKRINYVIETEKPTTIGEFRIITKHGKIVYFQSKTSLVTVNGKKMFFVILRDITELKEMEKALQESEKRYREIFENAVEGFFQTTPDGRFIKANPALARMFGYYSPDEMIEDIKNLEERYVNPKDRQRMKELYEKNGYIMGFETQFYKKDNNKIWIRLNGRAVKDESGSIIYYEGTAEDITERIEAENTLRESEERYRTLIENSNDGIAIIKGRIFLYANKRFAEIFGFKSTEEVTGRDILTIVHDDDKETILSINKKRQEGVSVPNQYEFKGVKQNGEVLLIEVSVAETFFYTEKFHIVFFRDETARKRLEEQLFHSQKMEAIGQLAGGVAHDFNNILTAIIGYAGLLDLKLDKDSNLRQYVKHIQSAAERATHLTQGLLTFSRKQVINLKPIDLNDVIRSFKGMLSRIIGEDIELELNIYDKDLTINGDPYQIEQIILNLATNARDAMPHGGKLTIETGIADIDDTFVEKLKYVKAGRYAFFSVKDTGVGIDDQTKEKIFNPFFTTKEVGRGTGLGLSIVYGIVKQHNGFITVDTKLGEGSTFKVFIPLIFSDYSAEEIKEDADYGGEKGSGIVLICEDDDDVRSFIKEILTNAGYQVLCSKDGEESIEIFNKSSHTIDVVILDIIMPKKNGIEVYEILKQLRPDIKALFISGYPEDVLEKRGKIYKDLKILTKPITPQRLIKDIGEMLNKKI